MSLRHNLILLSLALLCACGFELRGSNLDSLRQSSVYVSASGGNTLANEVRQQLQFADIPMARTASEADYVVDISNETFERKVLSVSAQTGKVEEYEILYKAYLTVTGPDGKRLIKSEPITAQRDYAFDSGAVLGSFDNENVLQKDISKFAASTVLRRLQAVTQ
jgi:LPS-assembly lipoprotein